MKDKNCAFEKDRVCDDTCIAYKSWYARDISGLSWHNAKCLQGDFMIKKQGEYNAQ